ncbi:hypothetical protein AKJ43_03450 [candidate division MSBL1 archaeon SCGC-AAA261D19]|uniref:Uncharacterized protein n=1 Tax=candidate division MSBL1 archaeon SCGC-AAA261D19 TaxID=1698273 RepID=A0A133V4F9_9EURY|nr:hypothetical protein AKJ43_03450 [candidate division MSBL1 archaeon SCGC-AAA261D19]
MNVDGIYERMCRAAGRFEKLKKFQKVPDELRRNIKIARLNIAGEDVVAFTAFITLISGGFAATVAFASLIFGLPLFFC